MRIDASEATVHSLLRPRQVCLRIFDLKITGEQLAKARLDAFLEDRELYVVIGFRTLLNPRIQRIQLKTGAPSNAGQSETSNLQGEFVWAIQYRAIRFTAPSGLDEVVVSERDIWISLIKQPRQSSYDEEIVLESI